MRSIRTVFTAALMAAASAAAAPPATVIELNGWVLNQHEAALKAAFGAPYQTVKKGSIRNDAHFLDADANTYMVFSVDESRPTHYIVMMQLTGGASAAQKHDFVGLQLGDPVAKVVEVLGKPDETRPSELPGVVMWVYKSRNYTLEIDAESRLFSIRIEYWRGLPTKPGREEVPPDYAVVAAALKARDVSKVMALLMPDAEVYVGGQVVKFDGAMRDQLADPSTPMARALFGDGTSLAAALAEPAGAPEVYLRVWDDGMALVNKFPPPKSGAYVPEMVWKYYPGGWRLWEISLAEGAAPAE